MLSQEYRMSFQGSLTTIIWRCCRRKSFRDSLLGKYAHCIKSFRRDNRNHIIIELKPSTEF